MKFYSKGMEHGMSLEDSKRKMSKIKDSEITGLREILPVLGTGGTNPFTEGKSLVYDSDEPVIVF